LKEKAAQKEIDSEIASSVVVQWWLLAGESREATDHRLGSTSTRRESPINKYNAIYIRANVTPENMERDRERDREKEREWPSG